LKAERISNPHDDRWTPSPPTNAGGSLRDRQSRRRGREWLDTVDRLRDLQRTLPERGFPNEVRDAVGQAVSAREAGRVQAETEQRRQALAGQENVADKVRATRDRVSEAVALA